MKIKSKILKSNINIANVVGITKEIKKEDF